MLLVVVRHAKAFEHDPVAWPDDLRRPLTAEGREAFGRLAKRLGRTVPGGGGSGGGHGDRIERVLASPAVRAWQTAQVLSERAGWPAPERTPALLPDAAPFAESGEVEHWSSLVRSVAACRGAAFVGHEPGLGRLVSYLVVGDPGAGVVAMRKGAAVALEIDADSADNGPRGRIAWMVTPRLASAWRRRTRH
jgi:phosphohistidine phosphatase SixA